MESDPDIRAAKKAIFKSEFTQHFNLDHTLVYYLFSEYVALCDNRAKNMFLRSDTVRKEILKLKDGSTLFSGNSNPNADFWKEFTQIDTGEVDSTGNPIYKYKVKNENQNKGLNLFQNLFTQKSKNEPKVNDSDQKSNGLFENSLFNNKKEEPKDEKMNNPFYRSPTTSQNILISNSLSENNNLFNEKNNINKDDNKSNNELFTKNKNESNTNDELNINKLKTLPETTNQSNLFFGVNTNDKNIFNNNFNNNSGLFQFTKEEKKPIGANLGLFNNLNDNTKTGNMPDNFVSNSLFSSQDIKNTNNNSIFGNNNNLTNNNSYEFINPDKNTSINKNE